MRVTVEGAWGAMRATVGAGLTAGTAIGGRGRGGAPSLGTNRSATRSAFGRGVALALAIVGYGATAGAQTGCGDAQIQRGNELRRAAQDEAALVQFQQAWEACHSARAQGQMGLAEAALGLWVDADRHLAAVLANAGDPWVTRSRAQLETVQAQVATHLGQLEVRGGVPGAEVQLDGHAVGTLPLAAPLRLAGGSATLVVRAAGYVPLTRMVLVTPGSLVRESITLVPAAAEPARSEAVTPPRDVRAEVLAPPRQEPARGGTLRALGWVAAGGAVLMLGGGVAATVVGIDANSQYGDCTAPLSIACQDHLDTRETAYSLQLVGFIGGGALAVTSVVLLLTAPSSRPRTTAGLRGCGLGPGAAGVACEVGF